MKSESINVLVDSQFVMSESDSTEVSYNILPVGRFHDKRYGIVNITRELVDKMAANFGEYPSYEVPVKLGHSDGAASPGKVKQVKASDAGLEITMELDADTAAAVQAKQYRYMSAEYTNNYVDKKTGKSVGPVLIGAALVNQPGHPYVAPLVLADDNFEDEKKEVDVMDEAKLKELEARIAELEAEKVESAKAYSDLESENKALMAEKLASEVNAFCETWTAKGVPPAVVNIAKPFLLSDSKAVKLSDGGGNDKSLISIFGDIFEAMPKIDMTQRSESGAEVKELSDIEKQLAHAKRIAEIANKGAE